MEITDPKNIASFLTELWNLEYAVKQKLAVYALSFGLLAWQYGAGSLAEQSLLALLCHTRKSSNLLAHIRAHIQHDSYLGAKSFKICEDFQMRYYASVHSSSFRVCYVHRKYPNLCSAYLVSVYY